MNIDKILKEKKITKVELANRMGILPQNVNANLRNPSEDTIRNIAKALGVPIAVLFEDGSEPDAPIAHSHKCPHCGGIINIKLE